MKKLAYSFCRASLAPRLLIELVSRESEPFGNRTGAVRFSSLFLDLGLGAMNGCPLRGETGFPALDWVERDSRRFLSTVFESIENLPFFPYVGYTGYINRFLPRTVVVNLVVESNSFRFEIVSESSVK